MDKNKNFNELEGSTVNPLKEFYKQRGLKYSPKTHLHANAMFSQLLKESLEVRESLIKEGLIQQGGKHE